MSDPICAKCGKKCALKYVKALGKCWHTYHFVCSVCNVMLKDKPYYEVDDQVLCQEHYSEKYGKKCVRCDRLIEGSAVRYGGDLYHSDCFICARCGKVLEGAKFFEHKDKPYCRKCVDMTKKMEDIRSSAQSRSKAGMPSTNIIICDKCLKEIPVGSKVVKAMTKSFHMECFNCGRCGKNIAGEKYFETVIDYKKAVICSDCERAEFEENVKNAAEEEAERETVEEGDVAVCHVCHKDIKDLLLRAMDKEFHEDCFVCANCKKPLKGEEGFMSLRDQPWCLPCYKDVALEVCYKCGKNIEDGKLVTSENERKKFHEKCFVCDKCKKSLIKKGYVEKDGGMWCKACLAKEDERICAKCHKVITEDALRTEGKLYHVNCFVCKSCGTTFANSTFFIEGGHPYCGDCVEKEKEKKLPVCKECGEPIRKEVLKIGSASYHENCFKCDDCGNVLAGGKFVKYKGRQICRGCADKHIKEEGKASETYEKGKRPQSHIRPNVDEDDDVVKYPEKDDDSDDDSVRLCAKCKQEIFSRSVQAMGRFWHHHHFCCASCENLLDGGFKIRGGKPYCLSCA